MWDSKPLFFGANLSHCPMPILQPSCVARDQMRAQYPSVNMVLGLGVLSSIAAQQSPAMPSQSSTAGFVGLQASSVAAVPRHAPRVAFQRCHARDLPPCSLFSASGKFSRATHLPRPSCTACHSQRVLLSMICPKKRTGFRECRPITSPSSYVASDEVYYRFARGQAWGVLEFCIPCARKFLLKFLPNMRMNLIG